MINYRIGGPATGKTFRLLRRLSGKEYVFVKYSNRNVIKTKRFIKESQEHGYYGNTSKAKVTTILDYMMGDYNDVNIVILEDFNNFISSIFRDKEVYININHKDENVKFIDVEKEEREIL